MYPHVDLLDEKSASGAATNHYYEEDSTDTEKEPRRKTEQQVAMIDLVDSSGDDKPPLVPSQSKVLRSLIAINMYKN